MARGRCALVCEALSARLDGEAGLVADAAMDAHLAGCAGCREFEANVADLTRRMRLRVLEPAPDLAAVILGSLGCAEPRSAIVARLERRWVVWHGSRWRRAGQWVAALVPLAVAVPAFALGVLPHPHVTPSRVPTPCTLSLAHPHLRLHFPVPLHSHWP